MSSDIFVYAPSRGVHTDDAIEFVVKSLEELFAKNPSDAKVLEKLRELGDWAVRGGMNQ